MTPSPTNPADDTDVSAAGTNDGSGPGAELVEDQTLLEDGRQRGGRTSAVDVLVDDFKQTLAHYRVHFRPANGFEEFLVSQLASNTDRLRQLARSEAALRRLEVYHVRHFWDSDRQIAAAKLAAGLAQRPALVRRELEATLQGCQLMIERWEALARISELFGLWAHAQRSIALDLLGIDPELRFDRTPLDPEPGQDPKAVCRAVVRTELERLRRLCTETLEEQDRLEHELALHNQPLELSREMEQLRREAESRQRSFWQMLELLEDARNRRGAAAEPPSQEDPIGSEG